MRVRSWIQGDSATTQIHSSTFFNFEIHAWLFHAAPIRLYFLYICRGIHPGCKLSEIRSSKSDSERHHQSSLESAKGASSTDR